MCFLLNTGIDYKLCYGEPKNPYVKTKNGTYWCAKEYQEMCNDEKEVEANAEMENDNWPTKGWADVCQNDLGITVTKDIAEYLLQGNNLYKDEFIELGIEI